MRHLYLVVVFSLFSFVSVSQDVKSVDSKMEKEQLIEGESSFLKTDSIVVVKRWKSKAIYALNGSQTSFRNWNSGGRTNIALLGFIHASANYKYKSLKWGNDVSLALGGVKYLDKKINALQKTDDQIDLASNVGYNLKKNYYLSFITGFKTQSLDGFNYPNDSVKVSTFMAPGYVNLALGCDYVPDENFGIFLSPFSSKMTFVNEQRLANLGSFGVEKAKYEEAGNLLTVGRKFRGEFGAYLKVKWNKAVAKNIQMKSKLELFSNYRENPENIDVNGELIFTFKVNSWFSSSMMCNVTYEADINNRDSNGAVGPRAQLKSVIGFGLSYTLMNYKEKVK